MGLDVLFFVKKKFWENVEMRQFWSEAAIFVFFPHSSFRLKFVLILIKIFREHGSSIEKALYKNMSVVDFVDRLLKKRAVVFMSPQDTYLLRFGTMGWVLGEI